MNNADEIARALRWCSSVGDSPIGEHWGVVVQKSTVKDAADLIESLQAENKEAWERTAAMQAEIRKLDMQVATMQDDLARVTAERDAAVEDMKSGIEDRGCEICKKYATRLECGECEFEWRGVKGELNA